MASFSLTMPLAAPAAPRLDVAPVLPAAPVAVIAAEAEVLSLPSSQPLAPAALPAPGGGADGAAMRPDQVIMSRQLAWPNPGGEALAASWRTLVRSYGDKLDKREQQARAGQLPAELLMSGQDPRQLRRQDLAGAPPEAWRFTVHAGGPREQRLNVISGEPDQPPGKRRRARAALRLELELDDGVRVTVQVEPLPEGLVVELCAPDAPTLQRLRLLQGELELAIARSGLRVLRWRYRDSLPFGKAHAQLPSAEAASMLTLPVFHALAELALLLPARGGLALAL